MPPCRTRRLARRGAPRASARWCTRLTNHRSASLAPIISRSTRAVYGALRFVDLTIAYTLQYKVTLSCERLSITMRPLRVKFILPALTEATSPDWRPIKYSLFPPLGLATLAAYLRPDDVAVIEDEHVSRLRIGDQPDLVVIQVYITSA